MNTKIQITLTKIGDALGLLEMSPERSRAQRVEELQMAKTHLESCPLYQVSPSFLCGRMMDAWSGVKDATEELGILVDAEGSGKQINKIPDSIVPCLLGAMEYLQISDSDYEERKQTAYEDLVSKCEAASNMSEDMFLKS